MRDLRWVHKYQLFLFDFDGLLVNTEELHFAAYVEMCRQRGFELTWNIKHFFEAAHFSATGLREAIYKEFPALLRQEPVWNTLYAEKQAAYMRLLKSERLSLMPGVAPLLQALEKANIKRCVVTNSTREQVESVQHSLPMLCTIPYWITREDYVHPKPDPQCYQQAIARYATHQDQVIGFEDSMRGYQALVGSGAKAVLIADPFHPQLKALPNGVLHFASFEEVNT